MRSSKFWTLQIFFQLAFGLTVFFIARYIYTGNDNAPNESTYSDLTPSIDRSDTGLDFDMSMLESLGIETFESSDPIDISRQADLYFANQQYAKAAQYYEKLLSFGPANADIHNNLGLTLQYIGRSEEALARLDEGAKLDPGNQRIWLTIGYVNSQTGNTSAARDALEMAVLIDPDTNVGKSAAKMLENIP